MQWKSGGTVCLFAGLLGTALGLGLGCRRLAPREPPPHQGAKLQVACPDETTATVVRKQALAWAARQQATVDVVLYEPHEGPPASADVWVLRPAELPRWAKAGKLTAVPEEITRPQGAYQWARLLPLYREQLVVWNGTRCAVPLMGESPVCCYRSDLYAEPARQKAYRAWTVARAKTGKGKARELRPPVAWEELIDQAEFFREHGPQGPAPSLPPLPLAQDEAALDRMFYQVAAPCARRGVREDERGRDRDLDDLFSFHYDLETGEPRIASKGFVRALELLKRLQACRPKEAAARPEEAFARGEAVLCVTDASWLVAFQRSKAVADKVGVCAVPGAEHYFSFRGEEEEAKTDANRVPYLGAGGWLMAVAKSPQETAAWHLLASLTGPEGSNQIVLEPRWGGPVRQDQASRDTWGGYDLDEKKSAALREAVSRALLHGLKNPVVRLRTPDQGPHRSALVKEVFAALEGKVGPGEALKRAEASWKELDRKKGRAATKAEYKLSLGLRPQ